MHIWQKKLVILFLLSFCFITCIHGYTWAAATVPGEEPPANYAENKSPSSWLYDQDQSSIYGDAGQVDLSNDEEDEDEEPNIFEKLLIVPLNHLTGSLYFLLKKGHITLDSIIMGRVDGHGVPIKSNTLGNHVVALFTFELAKGNVFGIISANVYAILRSVIYIIIVCAVFAKVVAAGWKGDGSRAMVAFKSAFSELIVMFLMLQLMPYLLDIIFYLRDVLLHMIYSGLVSGLGLDIDEVSGIVDVFKELSSKSILNALMYLGSVVITIWFMLQYIGLALSFCIYFFCFPFVCVNSLYSRNELMEWWKSVIGYAIVPIGDLVLLFIPAAMGLIGTSFTISAIQFCVCAMLIPARSVLRAAMGIRSNFAMEMAAMGALYGATRFAGGAMGAFGKTAAGIAGGVSDIEKSLMYTDASNSGANLSGGSMGGGAAPGGTPNAPLNSGGGSGAEQNSDIPSAPLDSGGGSGTEQEILGRYANTSNFEEPDFKGLSNEQRADLYRKRGMQRLAGAALGGVASAAGAALGAGAGSFLGVDTAGQYAGALASTGVQAGQEGLAYGAGFIREIGRMGDVAASSMSFASGNQGASSGSNYYGADVHMRTGGGRNAGGEAIIGLDGQPQAMLADNPSMLDASASPEAAASANPVVESVNIPATVVNDRVQEMSSFSDANFENYVGTQYDEIMGNEKYSSPQQRADALQARVSKYTQDNMDNWLSAEYPAAPKQMLDNYHGCIDYAVKDRYRFDEATGENTWDILSKEGTQGRQFTFK